MKLQEIFETIALNETIDLDHLERSFDDFAAEKLLKNETLARAFNIKRKDLEELYSEAYVAYNADEFEKSALLFRWLALFNPFEIKYWMGFGASNQLLNHFEPALKAYAIAALLDTKDPYPHYHAYECYMCMNEGKEALIALEDARERAKRQPVYSELRQEIESLQRGKKYA